MHSSEILNFYFSCTNCGSDFFLYDFKVINLEKQDIPCFHLFCSVCDYDEFFSLFELFKHSQL